MKGQVLLTVDGGILSLFASYMVHGSVATKIKTRFIASFYGCEQNIIFFSLRQSAYFFLQLITTFNMNETTVNFVQKPQNIGINCLICLMIMKMLCINMYVCQMFVNICEIN